ncbi:MAG: cobalamin-dependent protein [Lachnospiraceae bacterium]|nr:cobalamin-dependent protein [Lachnospiraceae bacterium]
MENTLAEIADSLEKGRCKKVIELVRMAVKEGIAYDQVLEQGLLKGMENVGLRFKTETVEIPEILAITRALNGGMDALKEMEDKKDKKKIGVAIVGTIRGDFHDMGKNLVRIMLESKGFVVVDLGVDVPAHRFADSALVEKADVVCCSGFLKESLVDMKRLVEELERRGIREEVYLMVGGSAVDDAVAKKIGADCYTADASECGEKAYAYCKKKRREKGKRYLRM